MRVSKAHKNSLSPMEDQLRRLMQVDSESDPAPDSSILEQLQLHLANRRPCGNIFWHMGGGFLLNVLRYRVPIYQAALGVAFVFVVMLYAGRSPLEGNSAEFRNVHAIQFADTTEMLDTLAMPLNNKIGRNLREDSLLAKFISTVM